MRFTSIIAFLMVADGIIGLFNFDWLKKKLKINRNSNIWKLILVLELIIGSVILYFNHIHGSFR